ncbi:MAG: hypothetical protein AVDCRST_MAG69-2780 [uncultured Solirubrobacteraceae bacterium]|uniref:MOSC domain-containing protein n=1 Tax=uncultured Solirubrobacteraceae bacterium TaxID=1162706 RepID=A0A6J4T8Q1_9ACTN|nr:MAG: hypothetical protein AVDCRST_MAG69-2780 [uncultured Solirubrobacteraceae bacterium]
MTPAIPASPQLLSVNVGRSLRSTPAGVPFGQRSGSAYLRILVEGKLGAGDLVEVDLETLPDHGVTVRLVSDALLLDRSLVPRALEAQQLIPSLREWMT